ncbi:hypothetical protein [Corynebacterium sp. HS2168-gen11]|uniref:hypothetical protein n=1 Tax=Corynebacterium sp. HS2168-gen11 TaxID=2974027 RepID=UPI00216AEDAB|nr:hypothetical protein [Corynebacterium sp. HS2168-gen11]MCS4534854.1 hypothetical protein [Corynebacterium sp. HS2168-gen11]
MPHAKVAVVCALQYVRGGMSAFLTDYDNARLVITAVSVRDMNAGMHISIHKRTPAISTSTSTTMFPGDGVHRCDQEHLDSETCWPEALVEHQNVCLGMPVITPQELNMAAESELFENIDTFFAHQRDGSRIADASWYHHQHLVLESHQLSLKSTNTANSGFYPG